MQERLGAPATEAAREKTAVILPGTPADSGASSGCRAFVTVLAGVSVVACAELSGLDDYAVASERPSLPLPGRPFLTGPICESCLAESCHDEDLACRADADCSASLACVRTRSAPTSDNCAAPAAFGVLSACALHSCEGACWAPDLRCVGRYTWPSAEAPTAHLTLHPVVLGGSAPGFAAKACANGDAACTNPVDQKTDEDRDGDVELDVPLQGAFASRNKAFVGRFLYEHPDLLPTYHDPGYPIWQDGPLTPAMATADQIASSYAPIGGFDPALATVGIQIQDCVGHPSGVVLEVSPKDDARILYWRDGAPSSTAEATSATAGAVASISYAPARLLVITAKDQATGAVLAERQLAGVPGALHILWMWPLTTAEQ